MSAIVLGSVALAAYFATSRLTCSAETETHQYVHQAPDNWLQALYMFAEALRYAFRESFGRWRTGDLLLGLAYLARKEQNVRDIREETQAYQLTRAADLSPQEREDKKAELQSILRDMQICMVTRFRKREHQLAKLQELGIGTDAVLLSIGKSAILKPLFIVVKDSARQTLVLLIRGTTSVKDVFTSLTCTSKPHHMMGATGVVLGYSHFGMLAGARWIYHKARPIINDFLEDHPGWSLRLVGHSLGGGTAALLCMMMREAHDSPCARATALCAACPSCMTLELAVSCAPYVTSIVNGADLVPSMDAASIDQLRQEVLASAWFDSLRSDMRSSSFLYRAAEGSIRAVGVGTYWTASGLYSATRATGGIVTACMARRPRARDDDDRVDGSADGLAPGPAGGLSRAVQRTNGELKGGREGLAEVGAVSGAQRPFLGFADAEDESDASPKFCNASGAALDDASHVLQESDLERFDMLEAMLDTEAEAMKGNGVAALPARVLSEQTYARMHRAALDVASVVRHHGAGAPADRRLQRGSASSQASRGAGALAAPSLQPMGGSESRNDDESDIDEDGLGAEDYVHGLASSMDAFERECGRAEAQFDTLTDAGGLLDEYGAEHGAVGSEFAQQAEAKAGTGGGARESGSREGAAGASGQSDATGAEPGSHANPKWRRPLYPAGRLLHMVPLEQISSTGQPAAARPSLEDAGDEPSFQSAVSSIESSTLRASEQDLARPSGTEHRSAESQSVTLLPTAAPPCVETHALLEEVAHEAYSRIRLGRRMLADHLLSQYLLALHAILATYQ